MKEFSWWPKNYVFSRVSKRPSFNRLPRATWTVTNNPFTFEYLPPPRQDVSSVPRNGIYFSSRRYERRPLDLWIWFRTKDRGRNEDRGGRNKRSSVTGVEGERMKNQHRSKNIEPFPLSCFRGFRHEIPFTSATVSDSGHCGIDISRVKCGAVSI